VSELPRRDTDGLGTVLEIVAAIRSGATSAEEVARRCLDAIEAAEPILQAWCHLDAVAVIDEARERDRQWERDRASVGPLHGVPIGVKDIIDVAGMPTTNGADIPVDGPATHDADVVAVLRAAGAVIVGKTVTTEFALFRPGPTTNPHDPSRTPGGSSSGSAAAVGAGTIPLAIGTQTAGSVVRPASFCGVVGGKPTVGSVPRDGVTLCSPTLDTIGMIGSDVEGVALALGVMASDPENFTPTSVDDSLRVGFCRTFDWDAIDPQARDVVESGVSALADDLHLIEVDLPEAMRELVAAQRTIMAVEIADQLGAVRSAHESALSPGLIAVLDDGEMRRSDYDQAVATAAAGRLALDEVFGHVDVLLAPAVLGEAPSIDSTGDPLLCRMWTLLGTPTIAVPGLEGPNGLPIGLQVVGPRGRDGVALGAARTIADLLAGGAPSISVTGT
jgi:Asp-tRNA(Asn)/Glu-tRNA(Gln) amidotransferase A subunit family amidase